MTEEQLQKLMKLKQYEQPEEGYFNQFLSEFQERQRSEVLRVSTFSLIIERLKTWANCSSSRDKLLFRSGLACAACMAIVMALQFSAKKEQAITQQAYAPSTELAKKDAERMVLQIKDGVHVGNELARVQVSPIDFSQSEKQILPVLGFNEIVF